MSGGRKRLLDNRMVNTALATSHLEANSVAGCRLRWQLVLSRLQLQYSPWYPPDELRNGLLVQKSKKTNYRLILL